MKDFFKTYRSDIPAGLVVYLVALPLCLGIALASGAPLFSGVISGIIGGIVIGFLSDSKLSVSGPAAGLTVIVFSAIATLGSFEAFLLAVFISGVIQLVLGYVRAGVIGHFFPTSVITGMLTAIGLGIIFKQIPHAFGYDIQGIDAAAFDERYGHHTFSELYYMIAGILPGAVIISVLSMGILFLWDTKAIKNNPITKLVPGPLVVVVLGVALNELFKATAPVMALGSTHLVSLPEMSGFSSLIDELRFPEFGAITNLEVWVVAFTIAIVGSLESLLSLDACDKLDPEKRISSPNKELKAQGWGNVLAGLVGGLPMTAVIVRSSANVNAGGKGKLSAVFHGALLLLSVLFFAPYLNYIPLSALAAVLIHVGLKLNKVSIYKSAIKQGANQYIPFFATIIVILLTDLLKGISFGIVVGFIFVLRSNFRSGITLSNVGNNYMVQISRNLYFFNKAQLRRILQYLPENINLLIDGTEVDFIDNDILATIKDFCETAEQKGIKVTFMQSETAVLPMFRKKAA
ncbi:SulP family inorganic anion transporter [Carboxylicivirga sediminis]|uniref:SulP family inorganic anion transporter n=1 Tax=Carboxylicivirga sediminis TaxID=2006564 RepID=A0A941F748_9BACT|nr:SulP family inorganic anion transporter [Carboxylicivirga sediminis]MBR8536875.1 SulP family inorganic anion transporter [Carboxylicivirga sediminis]